MKLIRTRWLTICAVTVLGVVIAALISLVTTPTYRAATRLFVSTSSGASASELYQGNRLSQERVISYAELLEGVTLAQRTIDKLGLNMSAEALQSRVSASAKPDTVLIDVAVQDTSPTRARDIANAMSDEFVMLVRELETPEGGAPPDARVVVEQRASVPEKPIAPRTSRNLLIGFVMGAVVGLGIAALREALDNTIKNRQTLEQITNVGIVGSIPIDKERRKQAAIAFEADNSIIAEAFRKLRTNLQFLAVDNPPRVIVVTSSMPHEGKSTTAINIALALAEAEHNVVLVDGDMRRPMLHKYLDLLGPVGFSTVLSGSAGLSDSLQKTRFPGLTVLTSGTIPPNPSELLGSQSARNLLGQLRAEFDYVIIDSTPLLAVTDAAILAAGADGVLLMARYGHTKREQLSHAVNSLADVGAPLLGTVFTMMPTRGSATYAYGYSYYGEEASMRSRASASRPGKSVDPSFGSGHFTTNNDGSVSEAPSRSRRQRKN